MIYKLKTILLSFMLCLTVWTASGQNTYLEMTLDRVVDEARTQSLSALIAKHNYLVSYWEFRTYKAQFLPSLALGANLGEYNRSITRLQDAETGEFHYVNNNYLTNSLNLSLRQSIPFTGGTISLITYLDRMDQFAPQRNMVYNSQPVYISYDQPLFSYNSLKWEKKIEPVKFEMAKRKYLEEVEQAVVTAVEYFFNLLAADENLKVAVRSRENNAQLLSIAEERFKLGTMTRDELLQLRHQLLNDDVRISDCRLNAEMAMIRLRTYLGYNELVELKPVMPSYEADLVLDIEEVTGRAEQASSEALDRKIRRLEAESAVARAKAQRGFKASIYAQFGLTQVGEDFVSAYSRPSDQEIVGLSLSIPILDWGLGKGKVSVAKSQEEVISMQMDQQLVEWRQDLMMKVLEFNLQGTQCSISEEADAIGKERYSTARDRFSNGSISVTELNTAQTEMDNSALQYLEKVRTFWTSYFELRRITLFDYMTGKEVTEDFDRLTGE